MGQVVRFVAKPEIERTRLVQEARAIYESIFPQAGEAIPTQKPLLLTSGHDLNPRSSVSSEATRTLPRRTC